MKHIISFTLLFLALAAPVFADDVLPVDNQVATIVNSNTTVAAKVNAIMPLISTAVANRASEKAEYAKMMPKKDAIDLASGALDKYLPTHNDAVRNLNIEQAQHNDAVRTLNADTAQHNANRCMAPEDNPGACAAYDAEAGRLNQRANYLSNEAAQQNQKADDLNAEKAKLDEIQKNLSNDVLEYTTWSKDYNARVQQNEANIILLVNTLKQILQSNDNCKKAIASGTDENMKEICGQLFDGNAIHDGKDPNQGTGTRSFGTGANPNVEPEPHN